ncbi:sphingomyelin phosphodiesterase [Gymnopilus junonius]|uniref:Sphingomyelin phosphodiesterase n=1 Tax=Gymnopilus junonius TaxID=109634 RepID=A0A9P5TGX4_GYMJU|nr:sphingomyelin phosphodiesterase [Gymnopilus junonius]
MLTLGRIALLLTLTLPAYASIVSEIIDAIEQAVDCDSCHALLGVLTGAALLGDTVFDDSLIAVCKTTGAADDDVCQGLITEQGPIIAHDLRSISAFGQTATKLCNALIGLCQAPAVNTFELPIPKAAPSNPKTFTSTGQPPFQVVHFSDVHIDRSYTPGSDANCTKPICCRNFADHTGPIDEPAGPLGHLNCDTPTPLVHSMMAAVSAQKTHFSIFTGDIVEAAIWLVNQTENTSDMDQFNNELATLLNSPVYPAIGNHEVAPVNAFPRNTTSVGNAQWVFDTQSAGWTSLIGSVAALEVKHNSGSYSAVVEGTNLMIISINSIYWYKDNFYLFDSDALQPDPNGVIAFAAQQLQAAEDAGMRAWIIGHMSPGSGDALHDQSNYFDQVVQRYKNTIAAQFFGHSHVDEFEIAYSNYNNQTAETADSIAFLAPSLTPRQANPSFRVYDIDPDTYEVMDSRTFLSDMTDPSFQVSPVWKQEYSARETYGPAIGGWPATEPLNAAFWHHVTEAFTTNDTLFQTFNSFKTRGLDVPSCTGSCQTTTICNLRAMRAENNCDVATPGFNFRREEIEDFVPSARRGAADHCEGLGLRSILENVARNSQSMDAERVRKRVDEAYG